MRLPRTTSLSIDADIWYFLRSTPVPQRITELTVCAHEIPGCCAPGDVYRPGNADIFALCKVLPRLVKLRLCVSCRNVTSVGFSSIVGLKELETLELRNSEEHGCEVARMLLLLARLNHLTLINFRMDMDILKGLPHSLVGLRLENQPPNLHDRPHTWLLRASHLRAISALPNLCHLDLSGSSGVVDWSILIPVAARLESLKLCEFDLPGDCDSSCFLVVSAMKTLRSLLLWDTCSMYDEVLRAAATLPMLENFSLTSTSAPADRLVPCGVSRSGLVALSNGAARRALAVLFFKLRALDANTANSLRSLCIELFAPKPGMPTVNLTCEFD